jgi:hypothetical protein
LGITLLATSLFAGVVVPRDLAGQFKMIGEKGKAAYVVILERSAVQAPWDAEAVLTRMKVRVIEGFYKASPGEVFEILSPGGVLNGTACWTTISPNEALTQAGRKVVVFVERDERIASAFGESARYLPSFAEIFDVQQGLAREATVIGQGRGAAIQDNVKLGVLRENVAKTLKELEKRGG